MSVLEDKKEKLRQIIKKLELSKGKTSSEWKKIITEHKEEFENIKKIIREKQNQIRKLIQEKKLGSIEKEEFNKKLNDLQNELTELESIIFYYRIGS